MRFKTFNEFFCEIGETITFTVTSNGTVHAVTFAKNEQDWDGSPFVFRKPPNDFTSTTVFMVYSNPSGGTYDIEISGNPGEFVHRETVSQTSVHGSLGDDSRGYLFFENP